MLPKVRSALLAVVGLVAVVLAPADAALASPALAAPSDFRVTSAGFDSMSLAWSRVPDADFYRVLVNGVWRSGVYDPASAVTVTQLQPGVTYTFEVQAQPAGGEFGPSATLRASTLADTSPPSAPTRLREARNANGQSIGLTWDNSTDNWGVARYRVYADGQLAMMTGPPVEWFWLTDPYHGGLSCGTTYTFTVRAMDNNGNLSGPSAPLTATTPRC